MVEGTISGMLGKESCMVAGIEESTNQRSCPPGTRLEEEKRVKGLQANTFHRGKYELREGDYCCESEN